MTLLNYLLHERILPIALLGLLTASAITSAADDPAPAPAASISGKWRAAIDRAVDELELTVTFRQRDDGQWAGTIDVPSAGVSNRPLNDIVVHADTLSFSDAQPGGVLTFTVTVAPGADRMEGEFRNGTSTFPFKMMRDDGQFDAPPPPAPPLALADVTGPPSDRASIALFGQIASRYSSRPPVDAVAELNRRIGNGSVALTFDATSGYLRSILDALTIPAESQMVVFSKSSVQAPRISPANPRALYFRDDVVVGFIRGAPFLEFAAADPEQGTIFYTLDQREVARPQLVRQTGTCLNCHVSRNTMDVPGMLVRSIVTGPDGRTFEQFGNYNPDDRTPLAQRWGGWYVTGIAGTATHMGNSMLVDRDRPETLVRPENLTVMSLSGRFDTASYASASSDIAALMVFEHQAHMGNLLTRMGWDARAALARAADSRQGRKLVQSLLDNDARETVDYLLFVDEAPLAGRVEPSTVFPDTFAAQGPFDRRGRTLRQLDFVTRLMRYPCSYLIYSPAFDSLPDQAKDAIYSRMWAILSGQERAERYRRLSSADRRAIVEILRDTKGDLPRYFR